jgi:histidyl-tRNA synthetase
MFRAERPQRGRYRQFHQAGCEVYGDPGPVVDAELLSMLVRLHDELGIRNVVVKINSVGNQESRARYRERLVDYLEPLRDELSDTSRERLSRNPLRILDSKSPRDQELLLGAPSTVDSLTPEDRAHFDRVCKLLDALSVPFVVDSKLVRGLDYYTRTVFEMVSESGELGAQNALVAGGRYDRMLSELGGPEIPAFGFAMGLERLLLALGEAEVPVEPSCMVLALGERAGPPAARLANAIRDRGVKVELDGREQSLKSKLRRANAMGASVAVLIGDAELDRGVVQIKNLARGSQTESATETAAEQVVRQLTSLGEPEQEPASP